MAFEVHEHRAVGVALPEGSGKGTPLPSPPPLRTVHASFPTYGSSLSERPFCRTRFRHGDTLAVNLQMARRMKQYPVL